MQSAYADQLKLECDDTVNKLRLQKEKHVKDRWSNIILHLRKYDIWLGDPTPIMDAAGKYRINMNLCKAMSELVRKTNITLEDLVKLYRNETIEDPRPNKDLQKIPTGSHEYARWWNKVVENGSEIKLSREPPIQLCPPRNHPSTRQHLDLIIKNYRQGQDEFKYLILEYDTLKILDARQPCNKKIKCYPIGAVPKPGYDTNTKIRQINDFSYPDGDSLNDCLDRAALFPVKFQGVKDVMRAALTVKDRCSDKNNVYGATTDVAGAYRHNPIKASSTRLQGVTLKEYDIPIWSVDLYSPFGNAASGYDYGLPGKIIHDVHNAANPQWRWASRNHLASFQSTTWADDTAIIEQDDDNRLVESLMTQYLAMTRILGPDAIAEEKDSGWFRQGSILGLEFDFDKSLVSMKPEKIAKALLRIAEVDNVDRLSRSTGEKLLGSLRYIGVIIHPAKAFFQRLHKFVMAIKRGQVQRINRSIRDDLAWMRIILMCGQLNNIPFDRVLEVAPYDIECVMDASGVGSCAADITNKWAFIHTHSTENMALFRGAAGNLHDALGINILEMTSALHAAILWAPSWHNPERVMHILFRLDNVSAVSWINRRYSPNERGQNIIRLLTLIEVLYNLRFSAAYIPGEENVLADAGSRLSEPHKSVLFYQLTNNFQVVQLPPKVENASMMWPHFFSVTHGQKEPMTNTNSTGVSGRNGAVNSNILQYCPDVQNKIPSNWLNSYRKHGVQDFLQYMSEIQSELLVVSCPRLNPTTDKQTFLWLPIFHSNSYSKASNDYPLAEPRNESPLTLLSSVPPTAESIGLPAHPVVYGESQFYHTSSCSADPKYHSSRATSNTGSFCVGTTLNSGMKKNKNVTRRKPCAFQSTYEEPRMINSKMERCDLCSNRQAEPFAQFTQPVSYVPNMTRDTMIKTNHLQQQVDKKLQQKWYPVLSKKQQQELEGIQRNTHFIHCASEVQQHWPTLDKKPLRSNYWADGNPIVFKDISDPVHQDSNHYQETCYNNVRSKIYEADIFGEYPTHSPSRSRGVDINQNLLSPLICTFRNGDFPEAQPMENNVSEDVYLDHTCAVGLGDKPQPIVSVY